MKCEALISLVKCFLLIIILIFNSVLAHGESWGGNDKPSTKTKLNSNLPPPYSTTNAPIQNSNRSRSQSKLKRSSQVRLRSDVTPIRPAYSRSQSKTDSPV